MREKTWGKEPFDLKFTILRMIRCLPAILGATALGVLLLWGGYYLKNVTFNKDRTYSAEATFFVDYADENWYVNARYFNDYTWNVWLRSDQFAQALKKYLPESAAGKADGEDLFVADVPADLRVVVIRSVTKDPETATARIGALKDVLAKDFTEFVEEIREIRMIDSRDAALDLLDLRLGRAFVLAFVVSFLAAFCGFLIREVMRDVFWLPTSLTDRFGLKSLGIPGEKAYAENFRYAFRDKKKVAVCMAGDGLDAETVIKTLRETYEMNAWEFLPVACPLTDPKGAEKLREADGILLVVKAGGVSAQNLGLLLDFLSQQDCPVTAATLWKADAWLVRAYYRFS